MEWSNAQVVALWGFLGAMVFGAVANRTQFCVMGGISDWVNMGSTTRFRAWMLAIGIALVVSQSMQAAGLVDLGESIYLGTSLGWLGHLAGGFLFGVGMTLGGGCGQRTLVRFGAGNMKSLVVLLMLGITAYMTMRGLLAYLRIDVIEATNIDLAARNLADQGMATLLSHWTGLGADSVTLLLVIVLGAGSIAFALKDATFRRSADGNLSGVVVGLLAAGAWYVTGVIGFDDFDPIPLEGFTFIAPVANTINYLMTWTGSAIGFGIATVFGMIAGSFLYAVATGTFRIETFTDRTDMLSHLYAGILMGFGGVLALGCTIGQAVTGLSTLALGSLVTLISIVLGCVTTLKMQYHLLDDEGFLRALRHTLADFHLLPRPKSRSAA